MEENEDMFQDSFQFGSQVFVAVDKIENKHASEEILVHDSKELPNKLVPVSKTGQSPMFSSTPTLVDKRGRQEGFVSARSLLASPNNDNDVEDIKYTDKTVDDKDIDDIKTNDNTSPTEDITDGQLEISGWGLPESVEQAYREKGITSMFRWQVECLQANGGKPLAGGNLVYSAPTSAGKTLVAEILMMKRVFETGKKAILILPFVSLAREKMFHLQDIMRDAGLRVEGFMGSQSPAGGLKTTDIAVATIEKANGLINRLMEEGKLGSLCCVVVDELHLLGDKSRGYLLELLLTKVRYVAGSEVQIIGMSATLPNLTDLADWLSASLYTTDYRPIPLTELVKMDNTIFDLNFKPVKSVQPTIQIPHDTDNISWLCLETILEGHSVLLFCPIKSWVEKLAESLASNFFQIGRPDPLDTDSASIEVRSKLQSELSGEKLGEVIEQLRRCPAGLDSTMARVMRVGIAFHHAGLTTDERDIVEAGFKCGTVRVLVATTTLSSGVNLPARRVILRCPLTYNGQLMDRLQYKQMVGRAGRKGVDTQGESILICKSSEQQKVATLVNGESEPVLSCLAGGGSKLAASMKRAILEVIVSGAAGTREEVERYAGCTLLASQIEKTGQENVILDTVNFLETNEFIRLQKVDGSEHVRYVATRLGLACLASSLAPDEGLTVFRELRKARRQFVLENELHIIYLIVPIYAAVSWPKLDWMGFLTMWESLSDDMKRVGSIVGVEERWMVRAMRGTIRMVEPEQCRKMAIHQRFYTALALHDLVHEVPLGTVADKYGATKGMLQSLQQAASTFAGMVTVFSARLGWNNLELLVSQFQERLEFGVQRELIDLCRLTSVDGARARILYDAGVETVPALASAKPEDVENVLHASTAFSSNKDDDGEKRKLSKTVFITGRPAMTEKACSRLMVEEARSVMRRDLGLKAGAWIEKDTEDIDIETRINHKVKQVFSKKKSPKTSNSPVECSPHLTSLLESRPLVSLKEVVHRKAVSPPQASQGKGFTNNKQEDYISYKSRKLSDVNLTSRGKVLTEHNDKLSESPKLKPGNKNSTNSKALDSEENLIVSESMKENEPPRKQEVFQESNSYGGNRSKDLPNVNLNIEKIAPIKIDFNVSSEFSKRSATEEFKSSRKNASEGFTKRNKCVEKCSPIKIDFNVSSGGSNSLHTDEFKSAVKETREDLTNTSKYIDRFVPIKIDFNISSEGFKRSGNELMEEIHQAKFSKQNETQTSPRSLSGPSMTSSSICVNISGLMSESFDMSSLMETIFMTEQEIAPQHQKPTDMDFRGETVNDKEVDKELTELELKADQRESVEDMFSPKLPLVPRKMETPMPKTPKFPVCSEELSLQLSDSDLSQNETVESRKSVGDVFLDTISESFLNKALDDEANVTLNNVENFPKVKDDPNYSRAVGSAQCSGPGGGKLSPGMALALEQFDSRMEFTLDSLQTKFRPSKSKKRVKKCTKKCKKSKKVSLSPGILLSESDCDQEKSLDESSCNDIKVASSSSAEKVVEVEDILMKDRNVVEGRSENKLSVPDNSLCVIDVCSNRDVFDNFVSELRCERSYSLSVAVDRGGQSVSEKLLLDIGLVVGLAVCWSDTEVYYISLHREEKLDDRQSPQHNSLSQPPDSLSPPPEDCTIPLSEKLNLVRYISSSSATVTSISWRRQAAILYQITGQLMTGPSFDPAVGMWLLDPASTPPTLNKMVLDNCPSLVPLLSILGSGPGCGTVAANPAAGQPPRYRAVAEAVLVRNVMKSVMQNLVESYLFDHFRDVEMRCEVVLAKMELSGMGLNEREYEDTRLLLESRLRLVEDAAFQQAGRHFNLASPPDVCKVLYHEMKLPVNGDPKLGLRSVKPGRNGVKLSANKEILEKLISQNYQLPSLILEHRRLSFAITKSVSPLLTACQSHPILTNPRIYPSVVTHTATGRISLHEPNMQNIPKDFQVELTDDLRKRALGRRASRRKPLNNSSMALSPLSRLLSPLESSTTVSLRNAIVPEEGNLLLSADYSQVELRILAHLSQDPTLVDILRSGGDVFRNLASQINSCLPDDVSDTQRQQAKQIVYGVIYGIGDRALADQLGVEEMEAVRFMERFKCRYPLVRTFLNKCVSQARSSGCVETMCGRKRRLPDINHTNQYRKSAAERQSINTRVQGSAADLVKTAMVMVERRLLSTWPNSRPIKWGPGREGEEQVIDGGAWLILQLHDELIYEVVGDDVVQVAQIVRQAMEGAVELVVPIPVRLKVGTSWGALQEFNL